jgi:hypothetical protein
MIFLFSKATKFTSLKNNSSRISKKEKNVFIFLQDALVKLFTVFNLLPININCSRKLITQIFQIKQYNLRLTAS